MKSQAPRLEIFSITGLKAHISDDEDMEIPDDYRQWNTKHNNYYAQKRILELEAKDGEDLEEKHKALSSKKLAGPLNNSMCLLRTHAIQSRLSRNLDDKYKADQVSKKLKYHSVEALTDNDYYYSRKYSTLLKEAKRMVIFE